MVRMLADEHNYNGMQNYLRGGNEKKDLVRFYYSDREDVFDLVSYQKGGRILEYAKELCWRQRHSSNHSNLYLTNKKIQFS